MPDSDPVPKFTVVYPEFDVRGHAADHLRAWTEDQTLERNRYRLVVVLSPDSDEESAIRRLLRPGDKIIHEAADSDTAMWNAGANAVDTEWLVFTEGHSPAEPECLESLERWLESEPDAPVGNFEIGHPEGYLMAKISDRWFEEQGDKWGASWPRLHRAGFAIRRNLFETLGRYGPFGQFAPPLLSAKLHSAGHAMELVPGARTIHMDDHDLYGHHFDTIDFVRGESTARESEEALFFENYFGHNDTSQNRLTNHPDFFREAFEAASRFIYQRRRIPLGLVSNLLRLFSETARHSDFSIALNEAVTLFEEGTLLYLPIPREWRYRWFVRAHRRVVETSANKWVREQSRPTTTGLPNGTFAIAEIGPWSLGGFHSLESFDGRHFRWSGPFFTLRFSNDTSVQSVKLETGHLRGEHNTGIFYAACGGFPLPPSCLSFSDDGIVEVRIPNKFAGRAKNFGLTFAVDPVPSSSEESKEDRKLGLPVFSVEVL